MSKLIVIVLSALLLKYRVLLYDVMTANFSDRAFGAIAAHCIEAHWLKERRKEQFCPAP